MKSIHCLMLCLLVYGLTLTSCNSYKKTLYFQDLKYSNGNPEAINNYKPLTIQPTDILNISISSLNPKAYNDSIGRVIGYSVDVDGNIKLPLVGRLKVSQQTTSQVEDLIQNKLQPYLKNAEVIVHMKNFSISVMGDVVRPGVYPVIGDRVTLTEALALAGDLNVTAQTKNVLLVREVDGKREYIPFDLTSAKLFNSPYFYLKHNDMIYVQPDKAKYASVDGSTRTLTLAVSILSVIAILVTTFR